MKLIIDIPKEEFENLKNSTRPMYWAEHLIKNGTPLNEVLDNIRAEIDSLPRELPTDTRNMVRKTRVLDIIDKYRGDIK